MSPKYRSPDTGALRHLSRIGLRARTAVEGLIAGIHKSRAMGSNVEFADFREYVRGDDIRHIDWKVYARTDRLFIKRFEEETNMRVYLALDCSRSMDYGSSESSKLAYASALVAALGYLFVRQGDSVSLVTFDEEIRQYLPPRNSPEHLTRVWKTLEGLEPGTDTEMARVLRNLAGLVHRRGLLIVLSDLFDHGEDPMPALAHFRHKKFEVIVFHILDPAEIAFDIPGQCIFRDLEKGESVESSPRAIGKAYRAAFEEYRERWKKGCHQLGADYTLFDTSHPLEETLLRYLSIRIRR